MTSCAKLALLGCMLVALTAQAAPRSHLGDIEPIGTQGLANADIDLDTGGYSLVLDDGATGAGNGAIYFGQDTDLSLYRSGANALVLELATLTLTGDLVLPAAGSFEHSGRTKWTSSADGIFEFTNNAGTQGFRADTATTNGVLYLYDENGGNLALQAHRVYTGAGGVGSLPAGTALTLFSGATAAATATGIVSVSSGAQTNVGDYASGDVTSCQTGTTNTDGVTGNCIAQTGASGDGTGADAGNHIWNVNGANLALTIFGATGDITATGTIKTEVAVGDAPAEPHACDAAHSGVIVTVDDTNNTAYDQPCVCLNLDGTGYDWRQLSDVIGTACVF